MQRSRKGIVFFLFTVFAASSLFSQTDSSKIDTIKTVQVGVEQAGVIYDAQGAIMQHVALYQKFLN